MNRYIFLLSALLVALPALAQGGETKPTPNAAAIKVREQIDDLNLLKSLIPLKMTSEQIEALVVPMKAASTAAAALQKQADDAVVALATDIGKAHSGALAGTAISEALEKKVAESAKAAADRYQAARRKAVSEILEVAKVQFTATQKQEIEKQCIAFYGGKRVPGKYKEDPSKAPRQEVLDLAVQGYIEQVMLFDRTLILMEKMRAAQNKPE